MDKIISCIQSHGTLKRGLTFEFQMNVMKVLGAMKNSPKILVLTWKHMNMDTVVGHIGHISQTRLEDFTVRDWISSLWEK